MVAGIGNGYGSVGHNAYKPLIDENAPKADNLAATLIAALSQPLNGNPPPAPPPLPVNRVVVMLQENGGNYTKGVLNYPPDDKFGRRRYEGDLFNGLPYGQGKLTLHNGDVIEGEFDNATDGKKGTIFYAICIDPPMTYIGSFKDCMAEGIGAATMGIEENRETWTGTWRNGNMWSGQIFDYRGNHHCFVTKGKNTLVLERTRMRKIQQDAKCCTIL